MSPEILLAEEVPRLPHIWLVCLEKKGETKEFQQDSSQPIRTVWTASAYKHTGMMVVCM
jgi:hypothetical protein